MRIAKAGPRPRTVEEQRRRDRAALARAKRRALAPLRALLGELEADGSAARLRAGAWTVHVAAGRVC